MVPVLAAYDIARFILNNFNESKMDNLGLYARKNALEGKLRSIPEFFEGIL